MNSILASLSAIIWCFIEPFLHVMPDKGCTTDSETPAIEQKERIMLFFFFFKKGLSFLRYKKIV